MKSVFTIESPIIYKIGTKCPHDHCPLGHSVLHLYTNKMSTRAQCLWLVLLHPPLRLLEVQIALGDRLPASTRMELRELVQQVTVQCPKQDHPQGPLALVEVVDQVTPDPREKLPLQHLAHDPLLPATTTQKVFLILQNKTIIVHKTVH